MLSSVTENRKGNKSVELKQAYPVPVGLMPAAQRQYLLNLLQ